ncbi:hypothetical protein FA15DRAFT_597106 [Coprinopsis marcescibilis]|uniref:Uncharacterized protein n=1 Tax=Coprinopsis marcescibilis TaxID=230819 RepID=A0A5C3KNA7_COPMA|nr:hypothetical protein FA15DRAFT_597106 [Coprinopsis marcescibilis]
MTQGPPPSAAESSRSTLELPPAPATTSNQNGHYNPYISVYSNSAPTNNNHSSSPGSWPTNWYQYYAPGTRASGLKHQQSSGQAQGSNPPAANGTTPYSVEQQLTYPALDDPLANPQNGNSTTSRGPPVLYPPQATLGTPQNTISHTEPQKSPPEPPEDFEHWDDILKSFLSEARLPETMKGLEADMLVLSPDWETNGVYKAVGKLVQRFQDLATRRDKEAAATANGNGLGAEEDVDVDVETVLEAPERPVDTQDAKGMEARKLSYASGQLAANETPSTPSSVRTIKSISQFLARNRARNNASNKTEFLYSLSERRKEIAAASTRAPTVATNEVSSSSSNRTTPVDPGLTFSCARTDARPIDRDAQMKYDIAKNSDGPLSRTRAKNKQEVGAQSAGLKRGYEVSDRHEDGSTSDGRRLRQRTSIGDNQGAVVKQEDGEQVEGEGTPGRYPTLDERLKNVEAHFGVRYVPSPPRTLLSRLNFLEDHIIKLEKEYPPWAALWFCQPGRGWPPPPRTTPIVVPAHLRVVERSQDVKPTPRHNTSLESSLTTSAVSSTSPQQTSEASPHGNVGNVSENPEINGPQASTSIQRTTKSGKPAKQPKKKSSLYRAVMEKLEVKKALEEYRTGK